jgi:hypothetical protein
VAELLAAILLLLGAQVSDFPDGRELILASPDCVISLWVSDVPSPGTPDSLSVQWIIR